MPMTPLSIDASLVRAWATQFNRQHHNASTNASLRRLRFAVVFILGVLLFLAGRAFAKTDADAPTSKSDAVIDLAGASAVFETSLDDYGEIWVDGEMSRALGQSGGSVVRGWNAPNRLIINRSVQPGQKIQLAIFGINGPLSNPPTNYIYMREAKLEFYKDDVVPVAITPSEVNVEVIRKDPALDAIVPPNPKIFKLAEGFKFTEGPVWDRKGGYLLFSDPNNNTIYKYSPK